MEKSFNENGAENVDNRHESFEGKTEGKIGKTLGKKLCGVAKKVGKGVEPLNNRTLVVFMSLMP